jgi:DNA-binding transcriptional MerR regulator
MSSTESTSRVSTVTLLAAVDDPDITPRTLEYWRQQDLLPKAERTGQAGRRPEWTYPATTIEQLRELMRLRAHTRQPDVLRVALWFRGFDIDLGGVRKSLVSTLHRFQRQILAEIERRTDPALPAEEAQWAALEQVARTLARKRGAHAPPRFGRQRQEERGRAMTVLLGLVLGLPGAAARLTNDGSLVERLIGLDRARRPKGGMGAWLTSPPGEALDGVVAIGSLPALIAAVEAADAGELMAARDLARTMLSGLVAFSRMADAFALTENAAGLGAWRTVASNPTAAVWLTALVVSIRRNKGYSDNLRAIVDAFDQTVLPADTQARSLADLTAEHLKQRLDGLPLLQQAGIKRLITDYQSTPE